jgi:nickel/cobalt transporter (NiCoT) family protein
VTSLSVLVALVVGGVELVSAVFAKSPDLARLGYLVVGVFVATWVVSALIWKVLGIERRWAASLE